MSVTNTPRKAGPYTGNNTDVQYTFGFKVFADSDLVVTRAVIATGAESTLVLTTDYSVTRNANQDDDPGGYITLTAALADTYTLTLTSAVPDTQPAVFTNLGGFFPAVLNNALDRLTILVQQLKETVSRSLKLAVSTPTGFDATLPAPVAYGVLGFNGTADGFAVTDPSGSSALAGDLASDAGADIVGYKLNYAAAASRMLDMRLEEWVSASDFSGVDNTGVTACHTAINTAISQVGSKTLVFWGDFTVSGTLNVTCNTRMIPGSRILPSGMAADAPVFNVTARTRHECVRIEGTLATDPANGTQGFVVSGLNASRSTFWACSVINLKYGFNVRTFSITLDDCRANSNTCNLTMSAASSSVQINDVHVRGGNYANPLGTYAIKIGDPDATTTVAAGQPHGSGISLNGFAVDGGTIKVDSALCVNIATGAPVYCENPASGIAVELGTTSQDGYVGNVVIGACFYSTMKYAVFCNAGVNGLKVGPSTYTNVTKCALYVMTDIYPFSYEKGNATSSFALAPEVHTGRRHATYTSHDFTYVSLPSDGVIAGIQTVLNEPDWQIAQAEWKEGQTLKRSSPTEYGFGRRYKTPATAKAGSLNSYVFTFTTATDAKYFNGGDEYDAGGLGGGIIDRVDYELGKAYLSDASAGSPTAGALSQNTSAWNSFTRTSTGSPPTTGSWVQGDYCDNTVKASGSPRGWDRVTTGSGNVNGTDWKTIGNLP